MLHNSSIVHVTECSSYFTAFNYLNRKSVVQCSLSKKAAFTSIFASEIKIPRLFPSVLVFPSLIPLDIGHNWHKSYFAGICVPFAFQTHIVMIGRTVTRVVNVKINCSIKNPHIQKVSQVLLFNCSCFVLYRSLT